MQYKETALHMACERGHVKVAATLLKNGANVDKEDKVRLVCPYMHACMHLIHECMHACMHAWSDTEWCAWFRHAIKGVVCMKART